MTNMQQAVGGCIYFENVNGRGDWGNLRVDTKIFCTHIVDKYNLKQIKVVWDGAKSWYIVMKAMTIRGLDKMCVIYFHL